MPLPFEKSSLLSNPLEEPNCAKENSLSRGKKKTCFQHLLQLTFNNFILEPLNVEAREAAETHFASHRNLNSRHILCTISQKKERMTMKEGRHEKGERERKKLA